MRENDPSLGWKLHSEKWAQSEQTLRNLAIYVQQFGHHWDGFKVGAAMLGWGWNVGYEISFGYNFKPEPGPDSCRCCAEEDAEASLLLKGCTHLIAVAIAAPPKVDDESGQDLGGCIIPCGKCRRRWADRVTTVNRLLVPPRAHLLSIRLDANRNEEKSARTTVGELLEKFPPKPEPGLPDILHLH